MSHEPPQVPELINLVFSSSLNLLKNKENLGWQSIDELPIQDSRSLIRWSLASDIIFPNFPEPQGPRSMRNKRLTFRIKDVPFAGVPKAKEVFRATLWNISAQKTHHTFWLDKWSHAIKPWRGCQIQLQCQILCQTYIYNRQYLTETLIYTNFQR